MKTLRNDYCVYDTFFDFDVTKTPLIFLINTNF